MGKEMGKEVSTAAKGVGDIFAGEMGTVGAAVASILGGSIIAGLGMLFVEMARSFGKPAAEIARGKMTVVFLGQPAADGQLVAVPIPAAAAAALEVAPG